MKGKKEDRNREGGAWLLLPQLNETRSIILQADNYNGLFYSETVHF